MSILLKLKSKLQDPSLYEAKIREFDECLSLLKNENVELHKRIDQLEASCQTSVSARPGHSLEEHVRQLQQENGRLSAENQCQRQEYEQFLDQLTKMVVRTAVMQENIRQECASIYHVIEQLANSTNNEPSLEFLTEARKEGFAQLDLNHNSQSILDYQRRFKPTESSISPRPSSSSTNRRPFDPQLLHSVSNPEAQRPQDLQRSETFTISKARQEQLSSTPQMRVPKPNAEKYPVTRTMATTTMPSTSRPSRLPSRCSTLKAQLPNTGNRSLSAQKESKLPIRQQTSLKKPSIPTTNVATAKKNTIVTSNRSLTAIPNPSIKKPIRPPSFVQISSSKPRSRSTTTAAKNNINTYIPSLINKHPRITTEAVKSSDPVEQRNSTSSESSVEEQRQMNQLLPLLQDEGYSTWSSVDVKEDVLTISMKTSAMDDRQRNIGLVENWLDTSTRQFSKKPVTEVPVEQVEESSISPFVDDRYSNDTSIPFSSPSISSSNKDISLDSLDSPRSKEQENVFSSSSSSSSSSTFSRSETFEKLLITQTLPNIIDDLADSTSSTSSTFNMSEYIEDHFIDQDDRSSDTTTSSSSAEDSISFETTVMSSHISIQPQKRLLFPGLLNRLICIRRVLSDSDLQRKGFDIGENENSSHVYHSNVINEHSVEVNLINTYGSETELHVWSHNCAEQRRFLNERQQQQQHFSDEIKTQEEDIEQIALERQMLLQQIYEYPWLLQENDLDRTAGVIDDQTLLSPSSDLVVPLPNPDFYQLCTLTNSSSFSISYNPSMRQTISPVPSPVL